MQIYYDGVDVLRNPNIPRNARFADGINGGKTYGAIGPDRLFLADASVCMRLANDSGLPLRLCAGSKDKKVAQQAAISGVC